MGKDNLMENYKTVAIVNADGVPITAADIEEAAYNNRFCELMTNFGNEIKKVMSLAISDENPTPPDIRERIIAASDFFVREHNLLKLQRACHSIGTTVEIKAGQRMEMTYSSELEAFVMTEARDIKPDDMDVLLESEFHTGFDYAVDTIESCFVEYESEKPEIVEHLRPLRDLIEYNIHAAKYDC